MARLKYFCVLEQQRTKLHHHPVSCSFLSLHPQQRLVRPACGPLVGRRPCFDAPECVLDLLHDPALAVGLKLVPVYQPIELLPQRGPVCEQGSDVGGRGGNGLCVRCCLFCFRSSPLCAGPTMLPVKRPRGNIPRIKIDRPRAWRSLRPPLPDILDVSHRPSPPQNQNASTPASPPACRPGSTSTSRNQNPASARSCTRTPLSPRPARACERQ